MIPAQATMTSNPIPSQVMLPEYAKPPLEEVVLGVQFDPVKALTAPQMGLYWSQVRDRYPTIEENPPLVHTTELPEYIPEPRTNRAFVAPFSPRCWFVSEDENNLIQLQKDQFFRNWRRVKGDDAYPRFQPLLKSLAAEWETFSSFVEQEKLGEVNIDQCELTYINHIDRGAGWNDFVDLPNVFRFLSPSIGPGIVQTPEMMSWRATYLLPYKMGRLHVEFAPVFRGRDFTLTLCLTLRARGVPITTPTSSQNDDLINWFHVSHELIVQAFDSLTQPVMHELWEKQS